MATTTRKIPVLLFFDAVVSIHVMAMQFHYVNVAVVMKTAVIVVACLPCLNCVDVGVPWRCQLSTLVVLRFCHCCCF